MLNLHHHSEYSSDGLSKVEDIALQHKKIGINSFALTDHGTVSAFPEAFEVARKHNMKFVPGIEAYMRPPEDLDSKIITQELEKNNRLARLKRIDPEEKKQAQKRLEELRKIDAKRNFHLTILAKNQKGLENIFKVFSKGELYYTHRMNQEALFEHSEGLVVLSGCLGSELCFYVKSRQFERARELALKYKEVFGDNYYIEIMHHGVIDKREEEKGYLSEFEIYKELTKIAKELNIPLVATNDGHYTCGSDDGMYNIYKDLIYDKTFDSADASESQGYFGDGYHVIDGDSLYQRLVEAGHSEEDAREAINNAHKIESEVEEGIDIQKPNDLQDRRELLLENLKKGWEKKRKGTKYEQQSIDRYMREVEIIHSKNFTNYFTNMKMIVDRAYDIGLLTGPGRGSGAGSEVAYLLDITKTDPLEYGLLFERFLNPSRNEMPDIDLDLVSKVQWDDRLGIEILIDSLKDKFKFSGRINNTVRASTLALFKKLGSYYNIPFHIVNRVTTSNLGKEMLQQKEPPSHAEFVNVVNTTTGSYQPEWDEVYRKLLIPYKLDGTVSGFSVHAGGVVMTECETNLPVNSAGVIDFNGDSLESYDYIKYDLLSLDALNAIRDIYGLDIDWEKTDDPKVWETIGRGELDFVFQLSGFIPRKMAMEGKPQNITEISDISAINRPGPLGMKLNEKWVDLRKGRYELQGAEVTLAKILREAFGEEHSGLLVYQEDVMRVCVDAAGFSLEEAENVRKAMGSKDSGIMDSFKQKFIEGWSKNPYEDDPEEVWEMLVEFSKYAFNKSHSVSYSLVSYMNAKMWTYKKSEYIEWLLNNAPKKRQEALAVAIKDGYQIVFPSYKESKERSKFEIKGNLIYTPSIKDLEFDYVSDFLFSDISKVDKNKIILSGLLDSFSRDRLGLMNIVKNIPDAKLFIPAFPKVDTVREVLENGKIAGLWDYEELGDSYNVTVFRARSKAEVQLYKDESLPSERIERSIKSDISSYGLPKTGTLSYHPELDTERTFKKFYALKSRAQNIGDDSPNLQQRLKSELRKEYRSALRSDPHVARLEKSLEDDIFTGFVVEINYFKSYGYLKMDVMFENGVYKFYFRNKSDIKKYQSIGKNKVIKARMSLDSYMSRKDDPVVLFKIVDILDI